jgi:hypothetical protein
VSDPPHVQGEDSVAMVNVLTAGDENDNGCLLGCGTV